MKKTEKNKKSKKLTIEDLENVAGGANAQATPKTWLVNRPNKADGSHTPDGFHEGALR